MKKGMAISIGVVIAVVAISIVFGITLSTSPDTTIAESPTETSESPPPSQGRVFDVRLSDGVGITDIP